ncbi:hypothetical protein [Aurantibacter sp.]|uniref:hypothetical protein n=1 Tax=Aurantibacter sp. TaxID=2807103 RepID=UPI003267DD98
MKKIMLNLFIMVLFFGTTSCDNDESAEEVSITAADVAAIKTIIMSGDWYISNYFDSENQLTTDYDDFIFNFNENGTIAATDGSSSLSGAWQLKNENSDDESSAVIIEVHFSSPDTFKKLSEDWEVEKYTDSQVELRYTGDEEEGISLLTFAK